MTNADIDGIIRIYTYWGLDIMPDVYLRSKDLEQKYQVSRATIDNWKKQGMPFIKIGRSVRFDEKEIEKWIRERFKHR